MACLGPEQSDKTWRRLLPSFICVSKAVIWLIPDSIQHRKQEQREQVGPVRVHITGVRRTDVENRMPKCIYLMCSSTENVTVFTVPETTSFIKGAYVCVWRINAEIIGWAVQKGLYWPHAQYVLTPSVKHFISISVLCVILSSIFLLFAQAAHFSPCTVLIGCLFSSRFPDPLQGHSWGFQSSSL